jgi:hypothetical protein
MDRRDGHHRDHPITRWQVKLLRLAVDALAALSGPNLNPRTRQKYARLYALLSRAADQAGTPGAAGLPDDRGFYRHVIQLEILSRGRVNPGDLDGLADVGYEITEGQWSGTMTTVAVNEQVSADRMAELLQAQGSDADFLLPADADDDLCGCRAPASSCTFPHLCSACGYRLPGTIGTCLYCADLIALNPDGLWAIAGTETKIGCEEAPDREHHPVLLLSAGTGQDGTCNCQEPGAGELDERTCRNCGYPLSETQRRELARLLGLSTEPGG